MMNNKRAQTVLEYAVLLAVVISAIVIMQVFVKRGKQGQIKQQMDSIGGQYAPKHTTSWVDNRITARSVTYTGGNTDAGDSSEIIGGGKLNIPDNQVVTGGETVTYSKSTNSSIRREIIDKLVATE